VTHDGVLFPFSGSAAFLVGTAGRWGRPLPGPQGFRDVGHGDQPGNVARESGDEKMKNWQRPELFEATTDGRYRRMVIEEQNLRSGTLSFPPGTGGGKTHAHPRSDEIFLIVDGAGTIVVEGEAVQVGPGDLVYIPPGEQHEIVVDEASTEPLVLFAVVAPNFGNDAVFAAEPSGGTGASG
jgi:mannose-6-phosphate isomerase-like protein (cupin superfamily)